MIKYGMIALTAMALVGCSSKGDDKVTVGSVMKSQLMTVVAARKAAKSGVKPTAKPFTMADAAKSKAKLIRVEVPVYKSASLAQLVSNNNGYKTYMTSGAQSLTFKGSEVTATRGLGQDLMARSVGSVPRVYKYLDHLNHPRQLRMDCQSSSVGTEVVQILDRTFSLRKIEEVCRSDSRAFKNVKWVSASGATRKAHQWVSDELGFIIVEWLN